VEGVIHHLPINLVPLPIDSQSVEFVKTFAIHIHDMDADVRQKVP